jgi:hypothetical protein
MVGAAARASGSVCLPGTEQAEAEGCSRGERGGRESGPRAGWEDGGKGETGRDQLWMHAGVRLTSGPTGQGPSQVCQMRIPPRQAGSSSCKEFASRKTC